MTERVATGVYFNKKFTAKFSSPFLQIAGASGNCFIFYYLVWIKQPTLDIHYYCFWSFFL